MNLKIKAYKGKLNESGCNNLCIFLTEKNEEQLPEIEEKQREQVLKVIRESSFKAKKGKFLRLPFLVEGYENIYLAGMGDQEKLTVDTFRSVSGELSRVLKSDRAGDPLLVLPSGTKNSEFRAVAEGITLGAYTFDKYVTKKDEEPFKIARVSILDGADEDIGKGVIAACSQNFARDLANEPGNVITPVTLAEEAKKLASDLNLECDIWDEKKIQDESMLALWHVGKGSKVPPRFIHLTYRPQGKAEKKVVIVGKGITFDSGGLNIKPGEHMRDMKGDKTGACVALGAIRGVKKMGLPVELHVVISAAENMPGGNSYRPDDIIKARNGKTIEVDNTDAEGRITLADSLSFASELEPDMIIDIATLTGACMIALGNYTAGLFSPSTEAAESIIEASQRSGERFWRLPMDDEKLRENIKSKVADVLNTGGRGGGAITAAMFLEEFVKEGTPWVHLDIAGVDNYKKPYGYYAAGSSGYAVRTCLEYLEGL